MAFLIGGANSAADTGFSVANSCRFNTGDTAYMHYTPSSGGNRKTWTFSGWFKRGNLTDNARLFGADTDSANRVEMMLDNGSGVFRLELLNASDDGDLVTTQVFRDPSAWYHVVVAVDTTQGTASNRVKIYINGTQVTSFSTETYPDQNEDYEVNHTVQHMVGKSVRYDLPYDGYMAEVVLIDGTAYAASDFGEFDEDSPTIWKPKSVSGLTFGTNGFYLDFEDSSNLGNDKSGGTDLTEVNLAAVDQATDTPTNNFCTCNPLDQTNVGGSSATMAEGNLKWTSAGNSTSQSYMKGTFGLTAGKWYWEAKTTNHNSGRGFSFGVAGSNANVNADTNAGDLRSSDPHTILANADSGNSATMKDGSNVTTGLTSAAEDAIVSIALDLDNQKFWYAINGTWVNSGDPAAGSNAPATVDDGVTYLPAWSDYGYGDATTLEFNFGGCPAFAISSGNADANGYGNFEYAVPSGFYALNTKNLGAYGG